MAPNDKIEISAATLEELFKVMRENTAATSAVDKKVTELCTSLREREKRCDNHDIKMDEYGNSILKLQLWQASETGVTSYAWKGIPVLVSIASLLVAVAMVVRK